MCSALRLGHQNSVRHSLEHVLWHVPGRVFKHLLVRNVPKHMLGHMLEHVPQNKQPKPSSPSQGSYTCGCCPVSGSRLTGSSGVVTRWDALA